MPLLANTMDICSVKNGSFGSPSCTFVLPPLSVPMSEAASSGVTFW
jgi:hypothetical protein